MRDVKEVVVELLKDLIDSNQYLGGMGEYGKGWNDKATSMDMQLKKMIEKWRADGTEEGCNEEKEG